MTWLVAMYISANQAIGCNVFIRFVILFRQVHSKELIQLAKEFLLASHLLHDTQYIVWHMEREVP